MAAERPFASLWRRKRLTPAERIARGKDARNTAPRSSHGIFSAAVDRPDPLDLLEQQATSRVPELVPIRYGRMLVSPFTFYRGAALIMATDLAGSPRSDITVQLCGDAHLSNFGFFGTPERRLIFDINDFDETIPGPWEWDVKRLATSFEVMGRDRRFSSSGRKTVVMECVRAYRERMLEAARMGALEVWYDHLEVGALLDEVAAEVRRDRLTKKQQRRIHGYVAKARTRDSVRVLARRAMQTDEGLRIVADPPLIVPIEDLVELGSEGEQTEELVKRVLASYGRTLSTEHHPLEEFRFVHAARKVVGVGSVGTRCFILLLVGRDDSDPLFLQVKEAQASVLEPFVGTSVYPHHGQRVVAGQHLMQAASDIFLGWQSIAGPDGGRRDYYVRQLHDWKGAADVEGLRLAEAIHYAKLCGSTLARAHARWGDRIAIASYLGRSSTFDRAIADFSIAYADQNERDYERFARAVDAGRIEATVGL